MEELNKISYQIIGCAYKVHSQLGPGLLESTYEVCLFYELDKMGLFVERQKELPVIYDSIELDAGYRIDLLVERKVIIALKAVDSVASIHIAQLMTYLKLSKLKLGLLLNFNIEDMQKGIHRRVM